MTNPDRDDDLRRLILAILRSIENFMDQMDEHLTQVGGHAPAPSGTGDVVLLPLKVFRDYVSEGAKVISMKKLDDGRTQVVVDHVHAFKLPPRVAQLMALLIEDHGGSADEFVSWKSRVYLRKRLGSPGRPMSDSALGNLIKRLKEILARDSVLPNSFVRAGSGIGVRFALRRKQEESNPENPSIE